MALESLGSPSLFDGNRGIQRTAPVGSTENLYISLLLPADIAIAFVVSFFTYTHLYNTGNVSDTYILITLLSTIFATNILHALDAYSPRSLRNAAAQLVKCFAAAVGATAILGAMFLLFQTAEFSMGGAQPREWLIICFLSLFGATSLLHLFMCRTYARWRKMGRLGKAVAVFGIPGLTERVVEHVMAGQVLGEVREISTFEARCDHGADQPALQELLALARSRGLDEIILAMPYETATRLSSELSRLAELPVDITLCPGLLDINLPGGSIGLGTISLLKRPSTLQGWNSVLKRGTDVLGSAVLLVLLAPLMLATALLIRLDSPGPVFYRQLRYGFNSQPFMILKFRTMRPETGQQVALQAQEGDPRVTRIGRFLRRSSIDELPQLINVLKGDMSLVGPRPHADWTDEAFCRLIECYFARLRVKPGITGWAQVNGHRGQTDTLDKMRVRVAHDLDYVEKWSLLLDLKILFMTIGVVTNGKNAI